jgi:hypothetical protein
MVTDELVALIVPLVLVILICTWKVSAPSVAASAEGVTVKLPVFELMVKLPLATEKSALVVVPFNTVQ